MSIQLKQIPIFLKIIEKYINQYGTKSQESYIRKTFDNRPIIGAQYQEFDEIYEFCLNANILKSNDTIIEIMKLGKNILDLEPSHNLNLNLKKLLIEKCFLNGYYSKDILSSFSKFTKTDNKIWLPISEIYDLFYNKNILSLLYDCGLLSIDGDNVILNSSYSHNVKIEEKYTKLSQDQIDQQLAAMKKIGRIAENIVLNFEKKRLDDAGYYDESNRVEQISIKYANAGYDIKSFNGYSDTNEFDRFIEVKGSLNKKIDFYWSKNEIDTAKKLGSKYWIYFVGGIDMCKEILLIPEIINDPILNLTDRYGVTCIINGYHIIKNI